MYREILEDPDIVIIRQSGCSPRVKPICVLKGSTVSAVYDFLKAYKGPGLLLDGDSNIISNGFEDRDKRLPAGEYTYEVHDLSHEIYRWASAAGKKIAAPLNPHQGYERVSTEIDEEDEIHGPAPMQQCLVQNSV